MDVRFSLGIASDPTRYRNAGPRSRRRSARWTRFHRRLVPWLRAISGAAPSPSPGRRMSFRIARWVYGLSETYGQSSALSPALVTAHTQTLTNLSPGTLYHFAVTSRDASGNSATSGDFVFTTATVDSTAPTVGITFPDQQDGTVAGTVTVTADASDEGGVAGVQFKLNRKQRRRRGFDGAVFGAVEYDGCARRQLLADGHCPRHRGQYRNLRDNHRDGGQRHRHHRTDRQHERPGRRHRSRFGDADG